MSIIEQEKKRYHSIRRVTFVGMIVNCLLATAQIVGGLFAQSQAVFADGIHTLSDLISDVVVLIAAKQASRRADREHPYGHGRFETIATIILGLMLAGVAVGIALHAIERLQEPEHLTAPEPIALFFALLAIIAKESLYHYTMRVAKRIHSSVLEANAWHHRSDAISSLVVIVGVAGALIGFVWLDLVAALIVSIMIFLMGWTMVWKSFKELVDTGLSAEEIKPIRQYVRTLEGVKSIHMLRTRKMGGRVFTDLHIQVEPRISVSEGHYIAETVSQQLKEKFSEIADVTVHIDPENDEKGSRINELPSRKNVLQQLEQYCDQEIDTDLKTCFEAIIDVQLHYLDGYIDVDLIFEQAYLQHVSEEKIKGLIQCCQAQRVVRHVHIYEQVI